MKRSILVAIIVLCLTPVTLAEITGARTAPAGELAIINSTNEAVWNVTPSTYAASYAVSDDGKTIYFASPKPGTVTFFAASVIDGLPNLEQYTFYNGVDVPENTPEPTPAPAPQPKPDTIESIVKAEAQGKAPAELTALADTFAAVVDGIDRGVVTTPTGARETFRAIWIDKGTAANKNALDDMAGLITAISNKVDNSTLETLKKDYSEAADALRSIIPAKAQTPAKTQAGGCSGGNCNRYQYRWGW